MIKTAALSLHDAKVLIVLKQGFAVAGTVAKWAVRIEDTSNVDTSFPGFADCLQAMGAKITQSTEPA